MAYYPTANPAAKHDLLCPAPIINAIGRGSGNGGGDGIDIIDNATLSSMDALSSSIVQSALPLARMPPDIERLATVYTYPDAPTLPKPLSRSPRVWKLVARGLFDAVTNNIAAGGSKSGSGSNGKNGHGKNDNDILKRCDVGVKLPRAIHPKDSKSRENSESFRDLVRYLDGTDRVAMLACDSAGRIGFVVPNAKKKQTSRNDDGGGWDDDTGAVANSKEEEEDHHHRYYAAGLYYAPMKEFLSRAKENHANHAVAANSQEEEDEPETWTPQYPPPPEEECGPRGWDRRDDDDDSITTTGGREPETWTPQYPPPPEEECGPRGWEDANNNNNNDNVNNPSDEPIFKMEEDEDGPALFVPPGASSADGDDGAGCGLFVPPGASDEGLGGDDGAVGLFKPPDAGGDGGWDASDAWGNNNNNNDNDNGFGNDRNDDTGLGGWNAVPNDATTCPTVEESKKMEGGVFHANTGAAAADAFYSGLTRTLDTRADSILYHMRSFNGWVKATQIAELDPDTSSSRAPGGSNKKGGGKKRSRTSPMRVLDLACGKGGDLGKWALHARKLENYVGVDVARGSLVDAAKRARDMGRRNNSAMRRCTFTLADLGEDVPGRKRSDRAMRMQKLLTWNLQSETAEDKEDDPVFVAEEGGGISESDRFDVVSIQFAIHYMMSTRKRARRFFHTVSSLLEVGGNLIATTIDARVVVEKLMGLGLDWHFDDADLHEEVDEMENEDRHRNGNRKRKVTDDRDEPAATVSVGRGVCRLKFDAGILNKVFRPPKTPEDMFGLQYTFTLVEGSDHAAGVGEAVDLPEWLTPIPALEELAEESGLRLEYATNFHKFYEERKNPTKHPMAHNALYNMKVLNRDGSISGQEWEVSRMYIAIKFRKVKESSIDFSGEDDIGPEEM